MSDAPPAVPEPDLEQRVAALEKTLNSTVTLLGRAVVTAAAASNAILAEIERHGVAEMSPYTDQLRAQMDKLRTALEDASRAE